ncbi:MAG: hypothetical protein K9M57_07445 [Phycisphaerae bacterium]|nr:hypothetical protein [Phycisphaerae bacterium]
MIKRNWVKNVLAIAVLVITGFASSGVAGEKPLKIFILSGQSNMVGHARGHTMATLFNSDGPRDKDLIQLVFRKDAKISKAIFDEQLARAKKVDEINKKIKTMTDATKKAELEGEVKVLTTAHDTYKEDVIASSVVSDRVYISSIADRNIKSGKLSVGFGADGLKIGPEYSFGLSIAEKIDGPILIIKTSWGGKSLHYDFRPPSAPDFKTTRAYADAKASAENALLRYEEAIKDVPANEKKYAADLAAYEEKFKAADDNAKKKLRKPRKPQQPRKPGAFNMDNAGVNYRMMNEKVSEVLGNLEKYHPDYNEKAGYEIAGFVWFQGFNDQFNPEYHGNYAENMKVFIQDVRKEYKVPKMPFIIGVLGTSQTEEKVAQNAVSVAQREAAKAPGFKDNVLAVESYTEYALDSLKVYSGWADHYCHWDTVGSDRAYHYLGSGKFFVRFGDAMADAMVELIRKKK